MKADALAPGAERTGAVDKLARDGDWIGRMVSPGTPISWTRMNRGSSRMPDLRNGGRAIRGGDKSFKN